jgi:hypothetical protein
MILTYGIPCSSSMTKPVDMDAPLKVPKACGCRRLPWIYEDASSVPPQHSTMGLYDAREDNHRLSSISEASPVVASTLQVSYCNYPSTWFCFRSKDECHSIVPLTWFCSSQDLTQSPAFHDFTKLGTLPNTVTPASCNICHRTNCGKVLGKLNFLFST